MFSKELEMLIEATLADGTITEKERLILHKRLRQRAWMLMSLML